MTGYLAVYGSTDTMVYTLTVNEAVGRSEGAGCTLTLLFTEGIPHTHLRNGKLMTANHHSSCMLYVPHPCCHLVRTGQADQHGLHHIQRGT
jgi:hypothetical protein